MHTVHILTFAAYNNMIIDSLPYIDMMDESYRSKIEHEIENEVAKSNIEQLHDDVNKLIGESPALRFEPSLYKEFCEKFSNEMEQERSVHLTAPSKRKYDGVVEKRKKVCPGIDESRYNKELNHDLDRLSTVAGYLRHQELVLERILPRTIDNQWLINNNYMAQADEAVKVALAAQETQIEDLNKYRESLQKQEQLGFTYLEQQWKDTLIRNLEAGI